MSPARGSRTKFGLALNALAVFVVVVVVGVEGVVALGVVDIIM